MHRSKYALHKAIDPIREPDMTDVLRAISLKGRDNARTPMQWDSSPNAGFTGASTQPWIRVNDAYPDINVSKQESDPESVLNYYRKLISLRKQHPVLVSVST
jgi:glycosidase